MGDRIAPGVFACGSNPRVPNRWVADGGKVETESERAVHDMIDTIVGCARLVHDRFGTIGGKEGGSIDRLVQDAEFRENAH